MPGLGGSRGREAGRQAGSWGWWEEPFFPMSLANPDPRFQAALQSPWRLLRHCAQSAHSGRKGRFPPSGRGWGQGEGRCGGGRSEHSEGSLTPPGWVYPWSHRGLSWENLRDFTPSTPQTDGDVRLREVLQVSRQHRARQLTIPIPGPRPLAAAKQKPPGVTSITTGSAVTEERNTSEPEAQFSPPQIQHLGLQRPRLHDHKHLFGVGS